MPWVRVGAPARVNSLQQRNFQTKSGPLARRFDVWSTPVTLSSTPPVGVRGSRLSAASQHSAQFLP